MIATTSLAAERNVNSLGPYADFHSLWVANDSCTLCTLKHAWAWTFGIVHIDRMIASTSLVTERPVNSFGSNAESHSWWALKSKPIK